MKRETFLEKRETFSNFNKKGMYMASLSEEILKGIKEAVHYYGGQTALAKQLNLKQPQLNKYVNGPSKIENITISTFERFLPILKNVKVLINDINIVDNSKINAEGHSQVVTGTNIQYAEKSGQINSVAEKSTQYAEKFDNLEKEVLELEGIDPLAQIAFMKLIKKNRG